jgi:tetratricopeptide (TPR) repeat protein
MTEDEVFLERMRAELEELEEYTSASKCLVRRFHEAADTLPGGYAVVLAAVDCARAGCKAPIPARDLIALARNYLARLRPGEPVDDEELRAGLVWAASCGDQPLPLLIKHDGAGPAYRVAVAISHDLAAGRPPIPPQTWEWLLTNLPPERLLEVGGAASVARNGNQQMAKRAWTRALETGNELVQVVASACLGEMFACREDDDAAIVALERADSDLLRQSLRAMVLFNLGLVYDRHRNIDRARACYQRAIDANDLLATPRAGFNLGLLLGELGDADGAEAAFTYAIEAKYYEDRAEAASALATILNKLGKPDRARAYYERAILIEDHFGDVTRKAVRALRRLDAQQRLAD